MLEAAGIRVSTAYLTEQNKEKLIEIITGVNSRYSRWCFGKKKP